MGEKNDISSGASKTYGIIGFIASIIALIGLFFNVYVGLVFGVIGLIFSIIQRKRGKTGLSTAGFIISIIAVAIGLVLLVLTLIVFKTVESSIGSTLNQISVN